MLCPVRHLRTIDSYLSDSPSVMPILPLNKQITTTPNPQWIHLLAIQSISKSESVHFRFTKTLKGVLLTLQKDKLSDSTSTSLNDV